MDGQQGRVLLEANYSWDALGLSRVKVLGFGWGLQSVKQGSGWDLQDVK
jgi:hypothetical protein